MTPMSEATKCVEGAVENLPKILENSGQSQQATNSNAADTVGPHNKLKNVELMGVPIVALTIDGQDRLCLAQISNSLLKDFSYNEIHNRRVALGVTCVQCTPVQLELLRRAGAMPVASRRCGMITLREAERLCQSFLGNIEPPKLPENFLFQVFHRCAWGCKGSFNTSKYNSSRAKCIKCAYCGVYLSPNKFIFHSHRASDSCYVQPDAANFNSWRRHLTLVDKNPSDELYRAWEDVKAMFNGGCRKRLGNERRETNQHHLNSKLRKCEKQHVIGKQPPKQHSRTINVDHSMQSILSHQPLAAIPCEVDVQEQPLPYSTIHPLLWNQFIWSSLISGGCSPLLAGAVQPLATHSSSHATNLIACSTTETHVIGCSDHSQQHEQSFESTPNKLNRDTVPVYSASSKSYASAFRPLRLITKKVETQ